jgi:hypothetical protein
MKEIDFKTIESLIEKKLDVLNWKYVLLFLSINLLVALLNWLIQRNIKTIENNIYRKKIREDKKIAIIEDIYGELVSFTYCLNQEELLLNINRLTSLEQKIALNKLYIDSRMNNKIVEFIDYIKGLLSDFRKKSFEKEIKYLNEIEKEFNR